MRANLICQPKSLLLKPFILNLLNFGHLGCQFYTNAKWDIWLKIN